MTYFERCNKEIKIDDWTEHLSSQEHLEREGETYCDICEMTFQKSEKYTNFDERGLNHLESDVYKKKKVRFGFLW